MIFNTRIQHFCSVVEAGSLHKAAQLLHLTAGSISRSLQKLREDVGFELFALDGRKLVLTRQGEELYRLCQKSIDEHHHKIRDIQKARSPELTELRIGTFELFSTHFLVDLLERKENAELFDLRTTVIELTPGKIETALSQGLIDFGITTIPVTTEGIEHLPVKKIEVGVYAKPGLFDQVGLEDLPFATPVSPLTRNTLNLDSIDGWNPLIRRRVKYRFEMLETALLAARKGLCAIFIPRYLGERPEFKLKALAAVERQIARQQSLPRMEVYLVKRRGDPESPMERKLHRALRLGL